MDNELIFLDAMIDRELKEHAESILQSLNFSASSAITQFYQQIVLHRKIPFEIKLPD